MTDDFNIDIFGQQSTAALTTPFLFVFHCPDSPAAAPSIATRIDSAVDSLCDFFQYLAGRVTRNEQGVYVIRKAPRPPMRVIDRTNDPNTPSWDDLVISRWPQARMDEHIFSPVYVLSGYNPEPEDRDAVLSVQITLLRNAVAVNIISHHQVMDGTGHERVIHMLNKLCQGQSPSEDEIRLGNADRRQTVTILDRTWSPQVDTPFFHRSSTPSVAQSSPSSWTNIVFSARSLESVKADAMRNLEPDCPYISTDDALVALIWSSVTRARRVRYPGAAAKTTTLARTVDPRRYLGISSDYPGYLHNMALVTETIEVLSESSLGRIASQLRQAVDPVTCSLGQTTRELATLIVRAEDKNQPSLASGLDLDIDINISSWANQRCYSFDLNLNLGKPAFFGRPMMSKAIPGLMFLMPRNAEGSIVLTACLSDVDMAALQRDEIFASYAEFVG